MGGRPRDAEEWMPSAAQEIPGRQDRVQLHPSDAADEPARLPQSGQRAADVLDRLGWKGLLWGEGVTDIEAL